MRYLLFVLLRSILLFVVLYGIYRLVSRSASAFWQGLTGKAPKQSPPPVPPNKKIEYRDVHDAKFKDEKS